MRPLSLESIPSLRHSVWARMLLGARVRNGLSVGLGLGLSALLFHAVGGTTVSASASVGMLITSIADQMAPSRGKLRQMAPVLWLAAPFTLVMQLAQLVPVHAAWVTAAVVALGGFTTMLGTAWGVRGAPLGFALLLAIVFSMSVAPDGGWRALAGHIAWFELGSLVYAGWALVSAKGLNLRYRTLTLAEALNELATMLRQQGARVAATGVRRENQLRALLGEQALLADKLQTARDFVLDAPKGPAELRLAGLLIAAIRLREQALACELELDLQAARGAAALTSHQAQVLETLWADIGAHLDRVCWALFTRGRLPTDFAASLEARSADAEHAAPDILRPMVHAMLVETHSLLRLAERGGDEPRLGLAAQARDWPRFRSPMRWPIAPLKRAMTGRSPVLRYAVRVAVALVVGYVISEALPWAAHPHWILLTIAVVMRTNLAQTLERRNARLIGTLLGCVLVTLLLSLHPSVPVQFVCVAFGAGLAHGFAQVRYLVAATAATVLALIQGQLLHTAGEFALLERLADTLIGTGIAWAFSYVLPAWERRQMPALLERLRSAQLRHATMALGPGETSAETTEWRLARREVLDSLALLGSAAERAAYEPLGVRPPLELLEQVQLRSYRLLAQLGALRALREQPRPDTTPEAFDTRLTVHLRALRTSLEPRLPDDGDASGPSADPAQATEAAPIAEWGDCPSHRLDDRLERRLEAANAEAVALGRDLAAARAWEDRRGGR